MHSLKNIQDAFKQHMFTDNPVIKEHIAGTRNVPNELRLDIYRNAYRERLIETLGNDYEILASLVGEEAFRRLCTTYINRHPSNHYSLRWFGENLSTFLDYSPDIGDHEWEAEMAEFEWMFINSFDAENKSCVTEEDAVSIPPDAWPMLSVTFHPSVNFMRLWWNTLDLWQTAKNKKQPPTPARLAQQGHCLMWRNVLVTQYRSLELDEAVALSAALSGASFSEICGVLAEELHDQDQVPIKAAGFLKTWLASGMLIQLNS